MREGECNTPPAKAGFRKYFENTTWLLGEKAVRIVSGLVVGIWIARYLGPEKFGELSYARSFTAIFSAFATLGISGIVIRELVRTPSERDRIVAEAFMLRLAGSFATYALVFAASELLHGPGPTTSLVLVVAATLFFHPFNVFEMHFQSVVESRYAALANLFAQLLSMVLKGALILMQAPLEAFAWALVAENALLAAALAHFYARTTGLSPAALLSLPLSADLSGMGRLLRSGAPLLLSTFIIALYAQLDQVMLKNMLDAASVGQYAAAFRLNAAWTVLPSVLIVSVTPALMGEGDPKKGFSLLYRALALYGLVSALLTLLLADLLVPILYGEAYDETASIFRIMVFSNLFAFLGAASSRWFIRRHAEKKILYRNLLGLAFNLGGNLLLIPRYGAEGAAVTTLLSQGSANLLYDGIDPFARPVFRQKAAAILSACNPSAWPALGRELMRMAGR